MATYTTKYLTEIKSFQYKNEYQLTIRDRDYTGTTVYNPVLAGYNSIRLRVDNAEYIRGTSLEFTLLSITDKQYIEFFTNDSEKFRVELRKYNGTEWILIWLGYIVPFNYSENYIAPPYTVKITATDGLGKKKDKKYTTNITSAVTELEVIQDILPELYTKTKSYSVDLTMTPALGDGSGALLESYMKPWIYEEEKYTEYKVLQDIAKKYEAFITQKNGRWHIQSKVTHTDKYYIYDTSLTGLEVIKTSKVLGSVDNEVYPVGNLNLDIVPPVNNVTIINQYNKTKSVIPGNFLDSSYYDSNGNLTKWDNPDNIGTQAPIGHLSLYNDTGGERWISYAMNAKTSDAPLLINLTVSMGDNLDLSVEITLTGSTTYYLTKEYGWQTSSNVLKFHMPNLPPGTMAEFVDFELKGEAFPEDGILEVRINAIPYEHTKLRNFYLKLNPEAIPDKNKNTFTINANALEDKQDISIYYASLPVATQYMQMFSYDNWLRLDVNQNIEEWTWNGITDTLINIINEKIKELESVSRYKLTGIIKADNLFFDYLTDVFTSGKKYILTEGIYDLQNDQIDGTLKDTALL